MKHADLISKMTVEEKAAILSGDSEWTSREIKRLGYRQFFVLTDLMVSGNRQERETI